MKRGADPTSKATTTIFNDILQYSSGSQGDAEIISTLFIRLARYGVSRSRLVKF